MSTSALSPVEVDLISRFAGPTVAGRAPADRAGLWSAARAAVSNDGLVSRLQAVYGVGGVAVGVLGGLAVWFAKATVKKRKTKMNKHKHRKRIKKAKMKKRG